MNSRLFWSRILSAGARLSAGAMPHQLAAHAQARESTEVDQTTSGLNYIPPA